MRVKLSILIPTRNRCYTLQSTIKTCLEQDYQDIEVVVCDNASNDGTKEMVDGFVDKRLRYFFYPNLVSMSMNWERGLKLVQGSHLILIGSDDALIPHSLGGLSKLIEKTEVDAINWVRPNYAWPDIKIPGSENTLSVPALKFGQRVMMINSRKQLQAVVSNFGDFSMLPCLYNSVIKTSLVEKISAMSKDGVYFQSQIPDIYSGMVNSLFVEEYLHSEIPFSVNGGSSNSNGVATFGTRGGNAIEMEFRALNSMSNLDFLKTIPDIYSEGTVIGECFLRVREHFPDRVGSISLDMQKLYDHVRKWIDTYYSGEEARTATERLEAARRQNTSCGTYEGTSIGSEIPERLREGDARVIRGVRVILKYFFERLINKISSRLKERTNFPGFSRQLSDKYSNIYQVSLVLSSAYSDFYKRIETEVAHRDGIVSFWRRVKRLEHIIAQNISNS